jgi:cation diffusion facilitator CzcD-associated flavoprotein CzcO
MTNSQAAQDGSSQHLDAVIVGAGFGGLGLLYRLREEGFSVRVFEAEADVGGTWYCNRYPGLRNDSPSTVYAYGFSDKVIRDWDWKSRYANQADILDYLRFVSDELDLRRHITFSTRVADALFDSAKNAWEITTSTGEKVSAKFLISAVGCLSTAEWPNINGLKNFKGEYYHTAQWPREGVDLKGKRVGIIGTGASGVQVITNIAEEVDHLTVFQRTAHFILPARQIAYDSETRQEMKRYTWSIIEGAKDSVAGLPIPQDSRSALDATNEQRLANCEVAWKEGGFKMVFGLYGDLLTNLEANDTIAEFLRDKIRETVTDPETAEKLVPKGYPFGAKRPIIEDGYYETYNRDNVELVDVKVSPIREITETGVRTSAGEYPLDVLVVATGFDAITGSLFKMDIHTKNGVTLKDKWASGPRAYLGLAVAGLPNMFMMTGPGSPSVFSNMAVSLEQHAEWITDCLKYARDNAISRIEATVEAEDKWVDEMNAVLNATLLPLADSWYMGSNIPGKPRAAYVYLGGVGKYRELCSKVADEGYTGFVLS